MNKTTAWVTGTIVFLAAAFWGGVHFYEESESERLEALAKERNALFVPDHAPTLGPADAKVTLVEFLDPECESCRAFSPYVKHLLKEFEGEVRLVVRYAPFHPNSKFAVKLLEAARKQGRYWETLEVFFEHQPEWGDHHHPRPELLWEILPRAGVDVEQVRGEMNDPATDRIIERDMDDALKLGVRRTPSFFVNGRPLLRFGYEPLRDLIRSEL